MKSAFTAFWVPVLVVVVLLVCWAGYLYLTNRTVDQTLARNIRISNNWTELSADPPLTAFRITQELVIAIPDLQIDRLKRLPSGQVSLPDGRVVNPQVEGVDVAGNTIPFHHSGFAYSTQDFVTYTSDRDLDGNAIAKIRIRSDEPFDCEEIFWQNRNPK